jgi:hypothetical protein
MAHYRAQVQISDLVEADAFQARRAIEQGLQRAGFAGWQITSLGSEDTRVEVIRAVAYRDWPRGDQRGPAFVIVAAAVWALWCLWLLFE